MTNYGKTKIFVAGSQIFVLFMVYFQTGAFQFSLVHYQKQTNEMHRPVETQCGKLFVAARSKM